MSGSGGLLDRAPAQAQLPRNVLDCTFRAAPTDVVGNVGCVVRVLAQQFRAFVFHYTALAAANPPHLRVGVNGELPTPHISYPTVCPVVPTIMRLSTDPAERFFDRLRSVARCALGSLKRLCAVVNARNPGNVYTSIPWRRLRFFAHMKIMPLCPTGSIRENPVHQTNQGDGGCTSCRSGVVFVFPRTSD